jgi:hypothetical protein
MKIRNVLLITLLLTVSQNVRAQTCEGYISQGRAFLEATNLAAANACFSNAVALCPNHQTGNVFYAATRLLSWPSGTAGSNFLNRLGMPGAGRDIYNWTAQVPTDTNGVGQFPADLDATEATALLRTNLLAELIGAEANLAKVTSPGFLLSLTSNETRVTAVTLDYGDIRLLRAMLQAAEYFVYTVYSWNLDVQWAAINSLRTNSQYTPERLLAEHPSLLTFATTNDLNAAKLAFLAAVNRYFEASEFIRNRPTNVVRLFNYDPDEANDEQQFRWLLADLTNSLTHTVPLTLDPEYSVGLGSHFSGAHTLRSFLPQVRGNEFRLGLYPDLTFGGVVYGVQPSPVDEFFASFLIPVPDIAAIFCSQGQPFGFQVNGLAGTGYVIQVSTNLTTWSNCAAFVSFGGGYDFVDPLPQGGPRRFYRAVERPLAQLPPPPNDNFANRIPLSGLGITALGYTANASRESGEPGGSWPATIWYSWTAPANGYVVASVDQSDPFTWAQVYTGSVVSGLTAVSQASYPHQYYNGFSFYATAGTTYQIQVLGWEPGGTRLRISFPPDLIVTRPFDGTVYLTSTNITISALSAAMVGSIRRMDCTGDGDRLAITTNDTLTVGWTGVGPGQHRIEVKATDDLGITTTEYLTVTVRPPNDNFTNRLSLVGASASATGNNSGASKETGEPNHAGYSGGRSVWWTWTAPANGTFRVTVSTVEGLFDYWYYYPILAVYTGTQLSTLSAVTSAQGSAYGAQVSFSAVRGQTYQIVLDDSNGYGGIYTLNLSPF